MPMIRVFQHDAASHRADAIDRPPLVALGLSALGIVFGDIGTSPDDQRQDTKDDVGRRRAAGQVENGLERIKAPR
jgi:hypothetical protein